MDFLKCDILSVKSGVLAHGTNCLGVMGAVVAKHIKNAYPHVYTKYVEYCNKSCATDIIGTTQLIEINQYFTIANCFTQIDIRTEENKSPAKLEWVLSSLEQVCDLTKHEIIHIPKIGCGLGGLDWRDVEKIIHYLEMEYKNKFVIHIIK